MDIRFSGAFMKCVKNAVLELERTGAVERYLRLKGHGRKSHPAR